MKQTYKIAVTGGVASGKSSVCNFFQKKGIPVISLDRIAHEVVLPGEPAFNKIKAHFGPSVIRADGSLNRPHLRKKITGNEEAKTAIESIVQPEILRSMNQQIKAHESAGEPFIVVEIPLLFELGMETMFDTSVLVCVSSAQQIERLMHRDNVTKENAQSLINIQMAQDAKLKKAEHVIENTGGIDLMYKKAEDVLKKIIKNYANLSK